MPSKRPKPIGTILTLAGVVLSIAVASVGFGYLFNSIMTVYATFPQPGAWPVELPRDGNFAITSQIDPNNPDEKPAISVIISDSDPLAYSNETGNFYIQSGDESHRVLGSLEADSGGTYSIEIDGPASGFPISVRPHPVHTSLRILRIFAIAEILPVGMIFSGLVICFRNLYKRRKRELEQMNDWT